MSTQIKTRRGTAAEHTSFTGAEGELTVNTTNDSVHVHDGATAGGHELARVDLTNVDKLAITGTGIDVTGTATMDGLTVDGDVVISNPTDSQSYLRIEGQAGNVADTNYAGIEFYNTDPSGKGPNVAAFIEARSQDSIGQAGQLVLATAPIGSTPEGERARQRMRIDSAGDISFYEDTGTTAKFFWDASAESLGIGTSSPSSPLDVTVSDATIYSPTAVPSFDTRISNSDTTVGASAIQGYLVAGASGTGIIYQGAVGGGSSSSAEYVIGARTGSGSYAERLRIDSSGNVGIGTSSPASPIDINRSSTDGAIATFRKDGSTVGSIGTTAAELTIGTAAAGLRFNGGNSDVIPWNVSTNAASTTTDLGNSGNKFKDLYLSGGVYLGGTGAANRLDDYETGTFTPTVTINGFTQTVSGVSGWYSKVGNIVTVDITITLSAAGYNSSYTQLSGLPFTSKSGVASVGVFSSTAVGGGGSGSSTVISGGATVIFIHKANNTITTGSWIVSHTYKVD